MKYGVLVIVPSFVVSRGYSRGVTWIISLACAHAAGQCSLGRPESMSSALAMLNRRKTAFSAAGFELEAAVVVKVILVGGCLFKQYSVILDPVNSFAPSE